MPLISSQIPPGMFRNGTFYQAKNRWYNGDRVRWQDGMLRPIGGWRVFETSVGTSNQVFVPVVSEEVVEVAREMLAWRANDGSQTLVIGTNSHIYAFKGFSSDTATDITPAAFTPQPPNIINEDGYGNWFYGLDTYGTPRPAFGSTKAFNWVFRTWGEQLLALPKNVAGDSLYIWDNSLSNLAVPITGADRPLGASAMHVTEQRIVMTAGTDDEPRLIKWSDSEDFNEWTPAVDNQAGFQILPGKGDFVEITEFKDQILLISETDLHIGRYIGPPYVYGFDFVAANCGCVSGAAVVNAGQFVVWPGSRNFFIFDGNLQRINCEVIDSISESFSSLASSLITGVHNPTWSEIWWFFSRDGGEEVTNYVYWDYRENHWATGTIDRTCGCVGIRDTDLYMVGNDGFVYEHEIPSTIPSNTNDASDVFVTTGPIEAGNGEAITMVNSIYPDFISDGDVNVTFRSIDLPQDTIIQTFGPYNVQYPLSLVQPVPTRAQGRTLSMEIRGNSGTWSLGNLRLDLRAGGMR
jgi:hypothetical protein